MNPFETANTINVEGFSIRIPNVLTTKNGDCVTFEKPNWVPDEEVVLCLNCKQKFTHLRRKHHCRNCGKIFCSKCCSDRIPLLHFGMKESQKICSSCKIIVDLILKCHSENIDLKHEGIIGLTNFTTNVSDLCKIIECGALYIMFSESLVNDLPIMSAVASALHNLAQNMVFGSYLVDAGCLKILRSILSSVNSDCLFLNDSLSALNLLCQEPTIRVQAIQERIIDPLLVLIRHSGTVAALAARVLFLLINNLDCHDFIVQHHQNLIPSIMKALIVDDFQIQGILTKMLAFQSAISEAHRRLILEEDSRNGMPLVFLLKGSPSAILLNTICTISNLAVISAQESSHLYISALCELLGTIPEDNTDAISHIGRGLGNFSEVAANSLLLLQHFPRIVSSFLKSDQELFKYHGCRIIIYLLTYETDYASEALSRNGVDNFLKTVFSQPGLADVIHSLLLRKVSRLSICQ